MDLSRDSLSVHFTFSKILEFPVDRCVHADPRGFLTSGGSAVPLICDRRSSSEIAISGRDVRNNVTEKYVLSSFFFFFINRSAVPPIKPRNGCKYNSGLILPADGERVRDKRLNSVSLPSVLPVFFSLVLLSRAFTGSHVGRRQGHMTFCCDKCFSIFFFLSSLFFFST